MNAIGILGGTFDPPHIAHVILASEALEQLQLDIILWVLTPIPPHKLSTSISPVTIRQELLQAAISGNPFFELSLVDMERDPPHYALDTMNILRGQYAEADLIYLMGEDSLGDLPKWHKPVEFLQACNKVCVMQRAGSEASLSELSRLIPGIENKIVYIQVPILEISSSDIRHRISHRKPFRYYLPEKVYQIIVDRNLYQLKTD